MSVQINLEHASKLPTIAKFPRSQISQPRRRKFPAFNNRKQFCRVTHGAFLPIYSSKTLPKPFSSSKKPPHENLDACKKCQLTAKTQLERQKIPIIGLSPVSRCTWMPPDSFTPLQLYLMTSNMLGFDDCGVHKLRK